MEWGGEKNEPMVNSARLNDKPTLSDETAEGLSA
jgi:hypothetical protein